MGILCVHCRAFAYARGVGVFGRSRRGGCWVPAGKHRRVGRTGWVQATRRGHTEEFRLASRGKLRVSQESCQLCV